MKIPFFTHNNNRITSLEATVNNLKTELADQAALIGLLTSTDNVLERIAKATEYLKSVEEHRQKNAGQRHTF